MTTAHLSIPHIRLRPGVVAACLTMLLLLLVALYMYFLTMSVVQVVLRKESSQDQRKIESEIAMYEANYIEAQHKVSERIASTTMLAEHDFC
jgi:hypothetical protein